MFTYEEVTTPGQAGRYFLARSAELDLLLHRVEVAASPINPNPYRSLSCTRLLACCIENEQYFDCRENHGSVPRAGFVRGRAHAASRPLQRLLTMWLDDAGVNVLESELLAAAMAEDVQAWDLSVVDVENDDITGYRARAR